jgi:hypothetical protein
VEQICANKMDRVFKRVEPLSINQRGVGDRPGFEGRVGYSHLGLYAVNNLEPSLRLFLYAPFYLSRSSWL